MWAADVNLEVYSNKQQYEYLIFLGHAVATIHFELAY